MNSRNLFLFCIIILLFSAGCGDDGNNGSGLDKEDVFVYGLIGQETSSSNPDSSRFWFYSRIYDSPNYESIQVEVESDSGSISLNGDILMSNVSVYGNEHDLYFSAGSDYRIEYADSENEYSGSVTILPSLTISSSNFVDNILTLEWNDIGADFYEVEVYDYNYLEKHYITRNTEFTVNLENILVDLDNFYVDVKGYSGFDVYSNADGNIEGCRGYLFGYNKDQLEFDIESGTFLKPSVESDYPDLDFILDYLSKEREIESNGWDFIFTYAHLSVRTNSIVQYSSFSGNMLVEPAGAVQTFSCEINDIQTTHYTWSGFYNSFFHNDNIFETWSDTDQIELNFNVNGLNSNLALAVPDSFSLLEYPESEDIPKEAFIISWRHPVNTNFFVIEVYSETSPSIWSTEVFVTENSEYSIQAFSDSNTYASIRVHAVSGKNPLKDDEPNMAEINGYYYITQRSANTLYFQDTTYSSTSKTRINRSLNEENVEKRLNNYMLELIAEKHPELQKHKSTILNSNNFKD